MTTRFPVPARRGRRPGTAARCLRLVVGLAVGLVVGLVAGLLAAAAAQAEPVSFPSLDGRTRLTGIYTTPRGAPPYPAAVFLHGCSGLMRHGRVSSLYQAWADVLNEAGYAVLMVDSATPRGFAGTCGPGDARKVMYRNRPADAYSGLAYLQALPTVAADRIALLGWSQGGATVLLSIVRDSIGRPVPPPRADFRAAVAFYPGACSDRLQARPYTKASPGTWSTAVPLLILQGLADNWTPPEPCRAFVAAARARGEPVAIKLYPDAHHAFDAPNLAVRPRSDLRTARGEAPLVGTNEAARTDALASVQAFLAERLK